MQEYYVCSYCFAVQNEAKKNFGKDLTKAIKGHLALEHGWISEEDFKSWK